MSTNSRKQKSGNHNDASWHESPDGTSARTRPFSFDDIMLRRKNREGEAKHVADDPGISDIALPEGNVERTRHSKGRDRKNIDINTEKTRHSTSRDRENVDDSVPRNSRRTSGDAQKLNLRRKRDASPSKNGKSILRKDKRPWNPDDGAKVTADSNLKKDRLSPGKNESHHQSTNKGDISDDVDDRSDTRQSRNLVKKEKVSEKPRVVTENPEDSSNVIADKNLKSDRSSCSKSERHHQMINKDDIHGNDIDDRSDMKQQRDLVEKDKVPERSRVRSEYPEHTSKVIADKNVRSDRSSLDKSERRHQGTSKDDIHSNDIDDRKNTRQDRDLVGKDKDPEIPRVRSENPEDSSKVTADKNVRNDRSSFPKSERHHKGINKDNIHSKDINHHISDLRQSRDLVKKEKVPERPRIKSEITREQQLDNGDRHLHRKRKTDDRMSSIPEDGDELQKMNARDVIRVDKLNNRHKDKSEKENRRKCHREEDKTRGRSTGKGHDSEKQGLGAKHVHLDESRSKRKRSRSTEHEKNRGRRSPSNSPKERKHSSKERKDKGELLSHSTGMYRFDVDKKIPSNGSSSHYRRNTGSASGLGGYSPRKRKSDTAAKTPSPTRRSPERRAAGWDLPPVGKESITGSSVLDLHALNQNKRAELKEFPFGTPLTQPVVKPVGISHHMLPSKIHAIESVQLTQATRPMRRLYAENLPASPAEKDLIECINNILLSSGVNYIQGTKPCISCMIHKEKGQALLEFLTPEDASAALSFDGIYFSGSNLKLRRPRDYTDVTTGFDDKSVVAVDTVSDIVEDSPNKIFIGGISRHVSSQMLLEIARGFGPVRAYHFEFIADTNQQCAFLEYVDHSVSLKACTGLNGLRLGGQVITAVFATPDAVQDNVGKPPFYGIPDHAKPLLENPTAVLTLGNLLDPVGLLALSESELEEILEDIRLECSRFGTVKSINVFKRNDPAHTTEAYETKDMDASTETCELELDDKRYVTEQLGESVNELRADNSSETSVTPAQSENNKVTENKGDDNGVGMSMLLSESLDTVGVATAGLLLGDSLCDNLPKDEMLEQHSDGDNSSPEDTSGQHTRVCVAGESIQLVASTNELESNVDVAESIPLRNIDVENIPLTEGEVKLEETNSETANTTKSDFNERIADKKDILTEFGDVFEPGAVFVEYRREKAACLAAHCFQGRIFDGRVVTAGYIGHDLYHMKFRR